MKKLTSLFLFAMLMVSLSATVFASNNFADAANNFNEADYEGANITYTEEGYPIVDYPNVVLNGIEAKSTITATTINDTWLYADTRMNRPIFMIPAGKRVPVLQVDKNTGAVQITYAGTTGWVHGSKLRMP